MFKIILVIFLILFTKQLYAVDDVSSKILRIAMHPLVEVLMIKVANNFQGQLSLIKTSDNIVGTTIGVDKLCGKIDENINILITTRLLNQYEKNLCNQNAKEGLLEIKIGYYALLLADNPRNNTMDLSKKDLFMALAEKMPNFINVNSKNNIASWRDVYKLFPNRSIKIYGPPVNSVLYEYLVDNIIIPECMDNSYLQRSYKDFTIIHDICRKLNKSYVGNNVDEQSLIQNIINETSSFSILSYHIYEANKKNLKLNSLDGVFPSLENIKSSKYSLSWPIYVYIKKSSTNNILVKSFMKEITSPNAIGANGYLTNYGLININPIG